MAEPLAVVKVGKIECGFLKLTPLSRTSAIAGAASGVTFSARRPSGTNRIRLWGVALAAQAALAANVKRLADSSMTARRIGNLPRKKMDADSLMAGRCHLSSFAI